MQLTTQMLAEVEAINTQASHIADEIVNLGRNRTKLGIETLGRRSCTFIAELNPYKVRLENILCETDVKEHVHSQCEFNTRISGILQLIDDRHLTLFTIMCTLMDFCKNEKLTVLKHLIYIEELLVRCKILLRTENELNSSGDDRERYLKMAMRIDSNDSAILHRKKKEIIY